MSPGRRVQRPHKPWEIGPRVWRRGRWYAVDLRWIDKGRPTLKDPSHPSWPEGGRRTEDLKEAERWAGVYVERYRGKPKVRRLGDMIEAYKTHRQRMVEPRTYAGDRTVLGRVLRHYPENHPVVDLDAQGIINAWLDSGLAATTVRQYVVSLRAFWQWLGMPFPDVSLPRVATPDVRYWNDATVDVLREHAPSVDPQLPVALDCALFMGLRVGEVFGLRWTDVNGDTVRVQRQIPQGRTSPKPLKGKRARTALILPGWEHTGSEGYVAHRDGSPIGRRVQWRWITKLLDGTGLNAYGAGWHTGRHTYARMCLESGVSMEQLQKFLGHASIRTTEEAYGHLREHVAITMARRAVQG